MNRVQDHLSKRTRMQCPNPERLCSHDSNEQDFEVAMLGCVPGPLENILKCISHEVDIYQVDIYQVDKHEKTHMDYDKTVLTVTSGR